MPGGPSGAVSIRILRPREPTGPLPVIVYTTAPDGCSATPTPTTD